MVKQQGNGWLHHKRGSMKHTLFFALPILLVPLAVPDAFAMHSLRKSPFCQGEAD